LRDRELLISVARALLAEGRWAKAVGWIKRFGLQQEFPPQELAKQFVEMGNWQAAMGESIMLTLGHRDWLVSMARALLANQRWAEAVRWVMSFGLQQEFPPQELAKQFVEAGNWQAAAEQVRAYNIREPEILKAVAEVMLQKGCWSEAAKWLREFRITDAQLVRRIFEVGTASGWQSTTAWHPGQAVIYLAQLIRMLKLARELPEVSNQIVEELRRAGWWSACQYWADVLGVAHGLTPEQVDAAQREKALEDPDWQPNYQTIQVVEEVNRAIAKRETLPEALLERLGQLRLRGIISSHQPAHKGGIWLRSLGFLDFWAPKVSGLPATGDLVGKHVIFSLRVDKLPDGRIVVNATNVRPVS
jgi:hypothetical protein